MANDTTCFQACTCLSDPHRALVATEPSLCLLLKHPPLADVEKDTRLHETVLKVRLWSKPSLQHPSGAGLPFSLQQLHGHEERSESSLSFFARPQCCFCSWPWGRGLHQSSAAPAGPWGGKSRDAATGAIPIIVLQATKKKEASHCMGKHENMDNFL